MFAEKESPTQDVLARLKQGTAAEHRGLEAALPLASPLLTRKRYIHLLRVVQAFVWEWEQAGSRVCPPDVRPMFEKRRRGQFLLDDLSFFQSSPLAIKPRLPPIESPEAFWGAMYVMEGSSLGGQIISRHLQVHLGLCNGRGYRYFLGHGDQTGSLWREFCNALSSHAVHLSSPAIVEGARQCFTAFHAWIGATQKS